MLSGEALEGFLQRNNLSHVIRAHEVKATGFQVCVPVTVWYVRIYGMCTYVCVCIIMCEYVYAHSMYINTA